MLSDPEIEELADLLATKIEYARLSVREAALTMIADAIMVERGDLNLWDFRPIPNRSCGHLGDPVKGCQYCDPETAERFKAAGRIYG